MIRVVLFLIPLLVAISQDDQDIDSIDNITTLSDNVLVRDSLLILADEYYQEEKYDQAVEILTEIKQWSETSAVKDMLSCCVLYKLALTYYQLERYQDAVAEIRNWIKFYNDSAFAPPYYYLLGQCYEEQEKWPEALNAYSYPFEYHPEHPISGKAGKKIIFIYLMAGEVDRAGAKVEETKSLMTKYPEIYKNAYGYGLTMILLYYAVIDDESMDWVIDWVIYETYSEGKINLTVSSIPFLQDVIADLNKYQFQLSAVPQLSLILADLLMQDGKYDEAKEALLVIKNWEDAKFVAPVMTKVDRMIAECEEKMGELE